MKHLSDEILIDYMEDELSEEEKKRVSEHLSKCEACSKKIAEYRSVFSILATDEIPCLAPSKWAMFLPDIYEKIEKPTLWSKVLSIFDFVISPNKILNKHRLILVPALTLVFVLVITSVVLLKNPSKEILELEKIIATEDAINEIDYLIEDDFTDFDDISLELFTEDLILDIDTEDSDISLLIDEEMYEKAEYIDELIYEEMDFDAILETLTDDEIEKIIEELNKKYENRKSV